MIKRFALISVSAASFALIYALVLRTNAVHQGQSIGRSVIALEASARGLERSLAGIGADLPDVASRLAAVPNLVADVHQYVAAKAFASGAHTIMPPAARARLDALEEKLHQHIVDFRANEHSIEAVALVGETGEVLLSDSTLLPVGVRISVPTVAPAAILPAAGGEPPALVHKKPIPEPVTNTAEPVLGVPAAVDLVTAAFGNTMNRAVFTHEGTIRAIGVAPFLMKNKVAGAIVVERRLAALPVPVSGEAFVVHNGKVILGTAPTGMALPATLVERPFVLAADNDAPTSPFDSVVRQTIIATANPAGEIQPGRWAAGFRVPDVQGVTGLVTLDVSSEYTETARLERLTLTLLGGVWLVHALMLLLVGMRLQRGVKRLEGVLYQAEDALGAANELEGQHFTHEVRGLVDAMSVLLSKMRVGGPPALAPAASPSSSPSLPDDSDFRTERTALLDINALPPRLVPFASNRHSRTDELDFSGVNAQVEAEATTLGETETATLGDTEAATELEPKSATEAVADSDADAKNGTAAAATTQPGALPTSDNAPPVLENPSTDQVSQQSQAVTPKPARTKAEFLQLAAAPTPSSPTPPMNTGANNPSFANEATVLVPAEQTAALRQPIAPQGAPLPPPRSVTPPTQNVAAKEPSTTAADDAREQHFRQVYQEFVRARESSGESGALPFEKFRVRLEESRALVVSRHRCTDVRFQVYTKNGKAAIKATPVQ